MPDYPVQPGGKIDFAVFPNRFKTTSKHPSETGKIEFTKEFLKAMLERAKTGELPVLTVAVWENTSKAGNPYKNFRLELARPEGPVIEDDEDDDDGLPF